MTKYNLQFFAETVDDIDDGKLVSRERRVAFMNVGTPEVPSYVRMQGFTSLSDAKSPSEYTRRYVDEATERDDVTGYASTISFSFDRYSPFSVHEKLADIIDGEKLGSDTHVEIVTVDFFTNPTKPVARKRLYSVIPDTTGDGTDALIYSGSFRAIGDPEVGTATSTDNWNTLTYAAPSVDVGA